MGQKKKAEWTLYFPVKEYLEGLGYQVQGEVKDCDMTAVCGDELIVVELKNGFTLELIYQAIRRQAIADGVYVAVPLPEKGYLAPHYQDMLRLCKRLELGLIFVGFSQSGKPQIDVAVHPAPPRAIRKDTKKRLAVLQEHGGRNGSRNIGGVTRRKILTVYKEQALLIAKLLEQNGELSALQLKQLGASEKTSSILQKNYYHWYERISTGIYRVSDAGRQALEEYRDLWEEKD